MLIYRLYILFFFLLQTLTCNYALSAEETNNYYNKSKNDKLSVSFDVMSNRYINMQYNNDKDSNYLFYKFNNIRIGFNPFYKINNKHLRNLIIKFDFSIGGFDDTFYNNQNLTLQYNILSMSSLTLYFGYVIFNCYNFKTLQVVENNKKFEIINHSFLRSGFILGLNFFVYKNIFVSIEYQDSGKYLNNTFDSKIISLGITYKIPI